MIKGKRLWKNGKIEEWDAARVHIISDTFCYGYGVFEGIMCYQTEQGQAVFRLHDHLQRLINSARVLYITIPYSISELTKAVHDTIKANDFTECYIRPMVYIDTYYESNWDFRNVVPQVVIAVWDWGHYYEEGSLTEGIRVKTSSYTRHHVNIQMTKAKAFANYMNFALARGEAVRAGFNEGLLLDPNGYVAEGPVDNVFMVKRGELYTPPTTNILEGITRDSILKIARDKGIACHEEYFTRDQLYVADEMFYTGTAAEVVPVTEVDHQVFGEGKPGPTTRELANHYFAVARGKNEAYLDWLSFVK